MQSDRLAELVERLGLLLRGVLRERASVHGLQPVHVQVLDYLARCNRYSNTPAALTSYLQATKGTVSQSLQRLVERGLVSKLTDTADRRVVRLRLTPRGRRMLADCSATAAVADAARSLAPGRVTAAAGVLQDLLRALQQANGLASFGQCRTCRHLQTPSPGRFRCGLTGESLRAADTALICHEHAAPD